MMSMNLIARSRIESQSRLAACPVLPIIPNTGMQLPHGSVLKSVWTGQSALQWQGRGLARRLWDAGRQAAVDAGGTAPFTVNASNYALDAYRKLGFMVTVPMAVKNWIRFNAMEWDGTC